LKSNKKDLLLIFTRNPELGKIKTRLAKGVGDQSALEIYKFLLNHTAGVTENLEVAKEVWYSEDIWKEDIWNNDVFTKKMQQGDSLGERMQHAFEEGFENGFEKIIIIGSDLYDLKTEDLLDAFKKLGNSNYVIGPAQDGGYYLLGMKKPFYKVFKNKSWGTPTVFSETMEDLEGKEVILLETRNDIDTLEDMKEFEDLQHLLN
jgi:rSAM/selenodomain-associated transferase 1